MPGSGEANLQGRFFQSATHLAFPRLHGFQYIYTWIQLLVKCVLQCFPKDITLQMDDIFYFLNIILSFLEKSF